MCFEVICQGNSKGENGSKSTNYYFMGKWLRRLRNIVFLSLFLVEKHGSRRGYIFSISSWREKWI